MKDRRWDMRIFVGTPTEVAQQVTAHIKDITPHQVHTVDGVAILKISCSSPVDGQLAVSVCAFVDQDVQYEPDNQEEVGL